MEKLIEYILDAGRRPVSPVGGGSLTRFSDCCNPSAMKQEQKLAHWMAFQTKTYGHEFLSSTVPLATFCKSIGLKTTAAIGGSENIVKNQVRTVNDLIKAKSSNPVAGPELKPYTECIAEFKKLSAKPVGGACFGPFTLAGAILGIERLCLSCIESPSFLNGLLDQVTDILVEFALECVNKGADFFWIAEPVAVLVSPEHFEAFSGNYIRRINACVSRSAFLHVPGNTRHLIEVFLKTGAQCLSLDSYVDMRDTAHLVPGEVVILGNINSADMLQDPPRTIEKKVSKLNEEIKNFPNFVISSGGGLSPDTPEENLRMMFTVTERTPVWNREEYSQIGSLWRTLAKKSPVEIWAELNRIRPSGKVIANSIEEALTYLIRQLRQKTMLLEKCQKQADHIIKILNKGAIENHTTIKIDEKVYRTDQLIRNSKIIFQEVLL